MTTPGDPETILRRFRQRILDLEAENVSLREQVERLQQVRADLPLAGLVQSVGLAAVLGEATMRDRVVSSISVSAQTYLVTSEGGVGVRFQPPELAERPEGLSTTSFELAKVPAAEGAAPRSLYAVLEDKQRLYGLEPWSGFDDAVPLVTELARLLADAGTWSVPLLARAAATVAQLERKLATAAVPGRPADSIRAFRDAIGALGELAKELSSKPVPVGGDALRLAAALDATTAAAARLTP